MILFLLIYFRGFPIEPFTFWQFGNLRSWRDCLYVRGIFFKTFMRGVLLCGGARTRTHEDFSQAAEQ